MRFEFWRKFVAEMFGCFCLTFFGCGTAFGDQGGPMVTALVFGCLIISMAYTIGPISGCHINPAVSLGVVLCGGLGFIDFLSYVIAQFVGAILAGFLLLGIISLTSIGWSHPIFHLGENGINLLGYEKSSLGINLGGGILLEVMMTFVFVTVILVNTGKNNPSGDKAGLVIGLTLSILIATGINFTGTSVNPARSFGPALALVVTGHYHAISQYWVFLTSPLVGAILAALFCRFFLLLEVTDKRKIFQDDEKSVKMKTADEMQARKKILEERESSEMCEEESVQRENEPETIAPDNEQTAERESDKRRIYRHNTTQTQTTQNDGGGQDSSRSREPERESIND